MSSLTMVEAKLPPGFRFHPRDDELVCDYLMKKLDGCDSPLLIEVDLNKCEPWDIPEIACVGGKEWYFYNQRDRKYATGLRTNRATATGYWKATGKDRPVDRRGNLVGMRKTLVFYQGRAPKGKKTEWVMHEFRIEGPFAPPKIPTCNSKQEDWVLCRVFYKNRSNDASSSPKSAENDSISMEETSSSSGLPPLMDSYITFDQTHVNAYQQVPCFSITSSSSSSPNLNNNTYNHHHHFNPTPNPIFSHNFHMHDNPSHENHAITKDHHHQTFGGNMMPNYNNDSPTNNNNLISPLTCDRKVLEVVLTHLTKMETSPNTNDISSSSFGEVASSQTFNDNNLSSHIALPPHHMWNQF